MPVTPDELFAALDRLGIAHPTVSHPPLFTVEQSRSLRGSIAGGHTKNLFLRDKKGALFLVTALEDAAIELKSLHRRLGATGRFSFGSADLMMETLGVTPGARNASASTPKTNRNVSHRPIPRGGETRCAVAGTPRPPGSSALKVLDGRRAGRGPTPDLPDDVAVAAAAALGPLGSRRALSARIRSSTGWLAVVSLSKRTPMPGVTPARLGSCSRIQTTVPSPAIKGDVFCSWKSNLSWVPTASGSRVRMKMPPRLTSTA